MSILSAILLLGFLIFIHELGHFIFAKMSGVKVLKFSLGFGPRLIGKRIGDTEYLISAVPLGGYVKMLGEDTEDEVKDSEKERSYKQQTVLRRASIVFGGPLFNLLTAVVIFFFVFMIGVPTLLPVVGEIVPDSPAMRAGLSKGDKVISIDGRPIRYWKEMTDVIHKSANKTLNMRIQRGQEIIDVSVTPEKRREKDIFGEEKEVGIIGIRPSGETVVIGKNPYEALGSAILKTGEFSILMIVGIIKLIQQVIPADTIGGPIFIFQLAEQQASAGAISFFTFAALISINLAVLNLLPIPILDGGHLLFLGIEAIRKRPPSKKTLMIAQHIGLAVIITLMVFAFYNDISRLISGKPLP